MINQEHKKLLEDFSISVDFAENAGVYSICKEEAERKIGASHSGLAFPYSDMRGNDLGVRIKLEKPTKDQKYAEKVGGGARIFFRKSDLDRLKDPKIPIISPEGEKAGLCAGEHLKDFVSLAPAGCWAGIKKQDESLEGLGTQQSHTLCDVFQDIPLMGRRVFFVPDSDFFSNPQVFQAGQIFIRLLIEQGAFVSLICLSKSKKLGLDDYITKYGTEKLIQLIDKPIWDFVPENIELVELSDFKKAVLWSDNVREKATQRLAKNLGLSLPQTEKKINQLTQRWKKFRPKKRSTDLVEIRWDSRNESTVLLLSKIVEGLLQLPDMYYTPSENVLKQVSTGKQERVCGGEDLRTFLGSRIGFVVGSYENNGDFSPDSQGFIERVTGDAIFKKPDLFGDFRVLEAHHTAPFLVQNGDKYRLIKTAGYHPEYQAYLDSVPIKAIEGRENLEYGFDYPYATGADRANIYSVLLNCFLKSLFCGEMPIFIIQGNTQNLGKTRLARSISYIFSNKDFGGISLSSREVGRETAIKLIAKLRYHDTIVADNEKSNGPLSSAFFDRITTQKVFSERDSHKASDFVRKTDFLVGVTLNDGTVDADFATRSVIINLDVRQLKERKTRDQWVIDNRDKILGELINMVEVWIASGCQKIESPYTGKNVTWASLVNGILLSNGIKGFMENSHDALAKIDARKVAYLDASYTMMEASGEKKTEFHSSSEWVSKMEEISPRVFQINARPRSKASLVGRMLRTMVGSKYPLEVEGGVARMSVESKKHRKGANYRTVLEYDPSEEDAILCRTSKTMFGTPNGLELKPMPNMPYLQDFKINSSADEPPHLPIRENNKSKKSMACSAKIKKTESYRCRTSENQVRQSIEIQRSMAVQQISPEPNSSWDKPMEEQDA